MSIPLVRLQIISEELNATVSALLVQLLQWQERKRDEVISKGMRWANGEVQPQASSKRIVAGLRWAAPTARSSNCQFAPNLIE